MIDNLSRLERHAPRISSNREDHSWDVSRQGCRRKGRLLVAVQRAVLTTVLLLAAACGQFDPYAMKFPQIGIGDNRARVIELMGQPDSVNSVEVPLLKVEQLAWRAPGKGRIYLTLMVMDCTAAKFSVD